MGTYPPNLHFTTASIPHNRWMKPKNFPSHQEHRCLALDSAITKAQLLYEFGRSREKAAGESLIQIPLVPSQIPLRGRDFQLLKKFSDIKFSTAFWFTEWNCFPLQHHQQQEICGGWMEKQRWSTLLRPTLISRGEKHSDLAGGTRCRSIIWVSILESKRLIGGMSIMTELQGLLLTGTSARRDVFVSGAICNSSLRSQRTGWSRTVSYSPMFLVWSPSLLYSINKIFSRVLYCPDTSDI